MNTIKGSTLKFLTDLTIYAKRHNINLKEMQDEVYKVLDSLKPLSESCDYDTFLFALQQGIGYLGVIDETDN